MVSDVVNGECDSIGRKWQKWDFIFLKVPPDLFKKNTHNKNYGYFLTSGAFFVKFWSLTPVVNVEVSTFLQVLEARTYIDTIV